MPHFLVDDDFAFHRKAIHAGNAAIGLWTRAGAFCQKQGTDGVVHRRELAGLGTVGQAGRLVEARLWHAPGHDCEQCPQPPKGAWVFHDWLGMQKTAEQARLEREAARERMRELRRRDKERSGNVRPNKKGNVPENFTGSSVTPSPSPSVVTSSRPLTLVNGPLDDDDLDRIASATGGDRRHAALVASDVLTRASGDVRDPVGYVLRAIGAEPDRYRPTPRNPRRDELCPVPGHSGHRDACTQCAADRLAGDAS